MTLTISMKRALLDTTISVDMIKMPKRKGHLMNILSPYPLRMSTSIALLEFKAVVLAETIFLYNAFRKSHDFIDVYHQVAESRHRQQPLRMHIIGNILNIVNSIPPHVPNRNSEMAEMAAEQLENYIFWAYKWFKSSDHVDSILDQKINCTRAKEPPVKKTVRFDTNLPVCKRGTNKTCQVEAALRGQEQDIRDAISGFASQPDDPQPNQFRKTLNVLNLVCTNDSADLSHAQCRNAGDCLAALEAQSYATHALSTNNTEWEIVAPMVDMEFVPVIYE